MIGQLGRYITSCRFAFERVYTHVGRHVWSVHSTGISIRTRNTTTSRWRRRQLFWPMKGKHSIRNTRPKSRISCSKHVIGSKHVFLHTHSFKFYTFPNLSFQNRDFILGFILFFVFRKCSWCKKPFMEASCVRLPGDVIVHVECLHDNKTNKRKGVGT